MRRILAIVLCGLLADACSASSPVLHGRVVDSESGKPIAGTIVAIEWTQQWMLVIDGGETRNKIIEMVTDAEGRFSTEDVAAPIWSPLTRLRPRRNVAAFKGGYKIYHERFWDYAEFRGARGSHEIEELWRGLEIRLEKPKTRQEILESIGGMFLFVGRDRPPLLTQAVREAERRWRQQGELIR